MYKLSKYNIFCPYEDGNWLVFNSYAGIKKTSVINKKDGLELKRKLQEPFDESAFSKRELEILYRKGIIVSEEEDELEKIKYSYGEIAHGKILNLRQHRTILMV